MNLIHRIFQNLLIEYGYPENVDMRININAHINDSMAFYCVLDWGCIEKIFKRINSVSGEDIPSVQRVEGLIRIGKFDQIKQYVQSELGESDTGLYITAKENVTNYTVFSSMVLSGEYADKILPKKQWDGDLARIWDEFISELRNDMIKISLFFGLLGYKILQSGCTEKALVREIKTRNYLIRVFEQPDTTFLSNEGNVHAITDSLEDFIELKKRWLTLNAEVICNDTVEVIGSSYIDGIIVHYRDKRYSGNLNRVVANAIARSR